MKLWFNCIVLLFCLNLIESSTNGPPFRCDYRYSSTAKGWFKYSEVPVTWFDARLRCALEGAVLASPTTPAIKAEMIRFINSTNKNEEAILEMFTGIHTTIVPGDYHTVEGTPLVAIPRTWAPNEPDNKDNKEKCLTLNDIGHLADVSCNETRPYVCYRSEDTELQINECGTIDPEYHFDRRTSKCYKFHKNPKKFVHAVQTCSAEGGHLAIINSDTEATVLVDLFAKYPESSLAGMNWKMLAFVGFTDWSDHSEWRTLHGQTLTEAGYRKFSPGNPDNSNSAQYCGAMFRNGLLDDMYCEKVAAFICEKSSNYNAACSSQN